MRSTGDISSPRPPRARRPASGGSTGRNRRRWWLIGGVVVVIFLFASLKSLATLYTDNLWFSSVHQHAVWSTLLAIKVGLFASFGAAFFIVLLVNLIVCDRISGGPDSFDPEDELVVRYQQGVRPYAGRVYGAVSLVVALIAASGSIGQWNNWILFSRGVPFGSVDPQFHWNVGFFVFKLPFLMFIVDWSIASLVAILVITAVFHYLNGGIRAQRIAPRVRPAVKAHLSVLLALIALLKAAGYFLQRFQLDVSGQGVVNGAGYTDVHARLPALELLIWISIAAAAVLLWNIRRQGWTLPVLAVGVWAFVALVVGVIYPALLQVLKVNPAQSSLEIPYIKRNIQATRAAYGLSHVTVSNFAGASSVNPSSVAASAPTLASVRLWDPNPQISLQTFQKLQGFKSYYVFQSTGVDRYPINGQMTPVVVGVRQINPANLPSSSWVNTHLQYTHGEGLAMALANQSLANGNPNFAIQNVPPTSSNGLPAITQPNVYFGLNDPGYVVANTAQPEYDFQLPNGTNAETHYRANGGVRMGSFLTRAAFAIRLGDFNLLISNLITSHSRIIFVRDVQQMVQKAAPFLSVGSHPYAVVNNGHIDWIINGYVTSSQYPYSENVSNINVPPGSGLPGSYNYVRNSVKVVINSYTGAMTFYAMGNNPILRTYEREFPQMFTPESRMSQNLRNHLRYPEDMFSAQAGMLGKYHITNPTAFYTAGNAWDVSPSVGVGAPSQSLSVTQTTNAQGQVVSSSLQPMTPIYQVLQRPGSQNLSFTLSDAYVSISQGTQGSQGNQNLTAFVIADSNPNHYGQITLYQTPNGQSVVGPAQANSEILSSSKVSSAITLLDQHGSSVLLGNILLIPVGQSILYVRPLYVTSTSNPLPQLRDVIAVFGQHVAIEPSLSVALGDVLGTPVSGAAGVQPGTSGTSSPGTSRVSSALSAKIKSYLDAAASDYAQAEADLKAGNLGAYQTDVANMDAAIQAAQQLLASAGASPPGSSGSGSSGSGSSGSGSSGSGSATPHKTSTSHSSTTQSRGATTTTAPA